ncbi:MAG: acyl-CoA dehydrogenase [Steroidobacteraceae bacterium]
MNSSPDFTRANAIAAQVTEFIRTEVIPYEPQAREGEHGPDEKLLSMLRERARAAGILTPHIPRNGEHLSHREIAIVLRAAGWSPLGMVVLNVAAPDEGNMHLLSRVATPAQQEHFLKVLLEGRARSSFFMTEPAAENGAGSDPNMMTTTARPEGKDWIINGRKAFITGAAGASVGIIMAKTEAGATMFLVDLPLAGIKLERPLRTIDYSMPGGHWIVTLDNVRVPGDQVLGEVGQAFKYAQVRLGPARLTHCSRWLGSCLRAHHVASEYTVRRSAFGKPLIEHEGVGFQLVDNLIDLKQSELITDWAAGVLDSGSLAINETSMAKVAVSEALFRVADRCVQVMGGTGITRDTLVEQVFRELRGFRIYDGPTEVHKYSLAKKIKRDVLNGMRS